MQRKEPLLQTYLSMTSLNMLRVTEKNLNNSFRFGKKRIDFKSNCSENEYKITIVNIPKQRKIHPLHVGEGRVLLHVGQLRSFLASDHQQNFCQQTNTGNPPKF